MVFELAFPGAILAIKFFTKLFVYRKPDMADAMKAFVALPVDIVFIGAAFALASILQIGGGAAGTLHQWAALIFAGLICLAILTTFGWQLCEAWFAEKHFFRLGLLLVANLLVPLFAIYQTYTVLKGLA